MSTSNRQSIWSKQIPPQIMLRTQWCLMAIAGFSFFAGFVILFLHEMLPPHVEAGATYSGFVDDVGPLFAGIGILSTVALFLTPSPRSESK